MNIRNLSFVFRHLEGVMPTLEWIRRQEPRRWHRLRTELAGH